MWRCQGAGILLLSAGITATSDMGTSPWTTGSAIRRLGDRGALRIRIISYGAGVDTAIRIGGNGPTPWLYGDRLRMGGVEALRRWRARLARGVAAQGAL